MDSGNIDQAFLHYIKSTSMTWSAPFSGAVTIRSPAVASNSSQSFLVLSTSPVRHHPEVTQDRKINSNTCHKHLGHRLMSAEPPPRSPFPGIVGSSSGGGLRKSKKHGLKIPKHQMTFLLNSLIDPGLLWVKFFGSKSSPSVQYVVHHSGMILEMHRDLQHDVLCRACWMRTRERFLGWKHGQMGLINVASEICATRVGICACLARQGGVSQAEQAGGARDNDGIHIGNFSSWLISSSASVSNRVSDGLVGLLHR